MRVLAVEDEPDLLGSLTKALREDGYAVDGAADGEAVTLTAREYALAEFLALRRGKVVTRTMLYEHLLDENDNTLSNLLDVHVSNIRKKLGHAFITTRHGFGFAIC